MQEPFLHQKTYLLLLLFEIMRNFTFSFSAITDFHTPTRFYLMKMRACPTLPLVEQSGMDIKFLKKWLLLFVGCLDKRILDVFKTCHIIKMY